MSERDWEAEYFAKEDREKITKLKEKWEAEAAKKALEERRDLHHNKCGKCGGDMKTVPFRGVEIEICGDCGAVLLDPGELEELAGKDEGGLLTGMFSIFSRD